MDLIENLKIALTIARTKSISAAARELNMTVPTVSRHLDNLEDRLKTRLFNRTTKGLFLTDDGDAVLVDAQELVERAENLGFRDTAASESLSGTLRLTAPARFGQIYIAPIVADFMRAHPNISIDLACTDHIQNLEEDGFDLAVRIGRVGQHNNTIKKIVANRRILVCSPAWLEQNPIPRMVSQLSGCDGLLLGTETRWLLKNATGEEFSVTPRARFGSRYGDVIREICEAGCGIALKSMWDVGPCLEAGTLVQIFPDFEQKETSDITLVYPDRRYVSARARAFSTTLENVLRIRL